MLQLAMKLKPPEDKRLDLNKLTDVGELMTLAELSDELRMLADDDTDEVTSRCLNASCFSKETDLVVPKMNPYDIPLAKLEAPMLKMEIPPESRTSEMRRRSTATPTSSALYQSHKAPLHHQQRLAHMPPTAQPDGTLYRGRELLSPSILSKQQTTGEKVMIPGAAGTYMCSVAQRSSPRPPRHESRISGQDSMYATMLRCPTTQADMAMRDAAGSFGMASRESFTKNNEPIGHSALFDASPCQSQTPADKNTAGRGQWKDRFSVGV